MKYTLLDMTQSILSEMSSDEVNSVSDTAESLQVANIIKSKYYDIVSRGDLPEHNQVFQLNPSLDSTSPVLMYIPDGIGRVEWIKYFDSDPADSMQEDQFGAFSHDLNTDIKASIPWTAISTTTNTIALGTQIFAIAANIQNVVIGSLVTATANSSHTMTGTVTGYIGTSMTLNITSTLGSGSFSSWTITPGPTSVPAGYKYVTMLPIAQFLDMVNAFNPGDADIQSFTFNDNSNNFNGKFTFYYKNDIQPKYCCILSNYYVIFDSYNASFDSTLQGSKTMCFGQVVPTFKMVDTFIPDLDAQQFPLLLNESKALAFYVLRQQPHQLAMQEVKRQWSTVQKNKSINNRPTYFNELANFGRQTGKYYGTRGFNNQGTYKDTGL